MKRELIVSVAATLLVCACGPDPIENNSTTPTYTTPPTNNNTMVNNQTTPMNTGTPGDTDGDGLSDADELVAGTDINNPDTDGDGLKDGEEAALGANPTLADTDMDGVLDGSEAIAGSNPAMMDRACGFLEQTATPDSKPVDVIFVVDNSFSMQEEIESIQRNINTNFADIIKDSGLDYRVIMISQHGKSDLKNICVAAPLSGTTCDPVPTRPANTERFYHYDTRIASHDSLEILLDSYDKPDRNGNPEGGWQTWLRSEAFKVIIEVTDDAPEGTVETAVGFDAQLLALQPPQFGVPGSRNYIFHSIIGLTAKPDATQAWTEGEAIQGNTCSTAEDSAIEYQKLSILTEGLRFPVCNVESYDAVFRAAAQGIIEKSRIACSFGFPPPPDGQQIDSQAVALEYRASSDPSAPVRRLQRVADAASCAVDSYYIEDGSRVKLCPTLCGEVEGLQNGSLTFVGGCKPAECEGQATQEFCDDEIDNDCNGFIDGEDPACIG
ncbi:MAG: hypothetical protein VYE40_02145 [Myxococcota bacterium]|jgi:hypothetical protein|nr:hypothetical protein [Myxococcota bacterium]MEC9439883.1 hypothetical protein [Myxococcota bacterium]